MSQNLQTFTDPSQKEAIVTDMLFGVIKTGKICNRNVFSKNIRVFKAK